MGKLRRDALGCAVSLAAMSSCGMISSGRAVSAFYAQTGKWSWLGIIISCIVYGLLMAGILRLKRRTGSNNLPGVYAGIFGRRGGTAFTALHGAFCVLCGYALMRTAADTAEIALPFHKAGAAGMFSALVFSLWLAISGNRAVKKTGCVCFALLAGVMAALAFSGRFPGKNTLHFYVELRLENGPWAAVLLALVHTSLAAGMCAPAVVRLFPLCVKPRFAGMLSAAALGALLLTGNGIFSIFPKEINALRYPFVALSASWGTAGFYIFAILRWLESVVCLSGIFCMLPAKK